MLDWLFSRPNFYKYPDTFGFRQEAVDDAVCTAVETRLGQGDIILLVCHFQETFQRMQAAVDRWRYEYEIPTSAIGVGILEATVNGLRENETAESKPAESSPGPKKNLRFWRAREQRVRQGSIFLTMSQMLDENESGGEKPKIDPQISVIVVERHPQGNRDSRIEHFARSTGYRTKLGYYLSFEQPLVDRCFGERERKLLQNWTTQDDHVFSSTLASRRINAKIKSEFSGPVNIEDCDSISQWLKKFDEQRSGRVPNQND